MNMGRPGGDLANAAELVHYEITKTGKAASTFLLLHATEMAEILISQLHEEQGGAHLPGYGHTCLQGYFVFVYLKAIALDQGGEVHPGAGAEILVEGAVDGEQAATAENAPVVAAAGKHRGIANGQILPAGVVGHFPEDGVEHCRGVGGRAAPPPAPLPYRVQAQILRMWRGERSCCAAPFDYAPCGRSAQGGTIGSVWGGE